MEFLIWEGAYSLEEARAAIFNYNLSRPGIWAIELTEARKVIGCIDLRLAPEHEKASFGYVLNRDYWGAGYMTEALVSVLEFCFGKLRVNRVESTHYVGNEGSGRVTEKSGMKFVGVMKQSEKIKGVFRDVVHYGITREEWKLL
jgi:ribosomal-protein-alanine N-acetyltransferase